MSHEREQRRGNGDPWRGMDQSTQPRDNSTPKDDRQWNGTSDQQQRGNGDAWKGIGSRKRGPE